MTRRISRPPSNDINILCDIQPGLLPSQFFSFNQVVAWYLRRAFQEEGINADFVDVHLPDHGAVPKATHTINTSGWATDRIQNDMDYKQKIRNSTNGKLCMYLDSDLPKYDRWYDKIFTVIPPIKGNDPAFVFAGWGADPDLFHPDSDGKTIFVDSYVGDVFPGNPYQEVEDLYREVLPLLEDLGWNILQPIIHYTDKRILFGEYSKLIKKGTVFFLTQVGESGLSKIEALYCGQPLIVHKKTYRPRTEGQYPEAVFVWETVGDLMKHMQEPLPDPGKIREIGMQDTWNKVVKRIIAELYK